MASLVRFRAAREDQIANCTRGLLVRSGFRWSAALKYGVHITIHLQMTPFYLRMLVKWEEQEEDCPRRGNRIQLLLSRIEDQDRRRIWKRLLNAGVPCGKRRSYLSGFAREVLVSSGFGPP
jgi:hypothetical protein